MNARENYELRVKLCRELRDLEYNLEDIKDIREVYNRTKGENRKFTVSIGVQGKLYNYILDKKTADRCFDSIVDSLTAQREEVIHLFEQTMK